MELHLFPEGWGSLKKIPSVGEVLIFSGTTQYTFPSLYFQKYSKCMKMSTWKSYWSQCMDWGGLPEGSIDLNTLVLMHLSMPRPKGGGGGLGILIFFILTLWAKNNCQKYQKQMAYFFSTICNWKIKLSKSPPPPWGYTSQSNSFGLSTTPPPLSLILIGALNWAGYKLYPKWPSLRHPSLKNENLRQWIFKSTKICKEKVVGEQNVALHQHFPYISSKVCENSNCCIDLLFNFRGLFPCMAYFNL